MATAESLAESDPAKELTGRARSLANLRPIQPGERRNPNPANNGSSKRCEVVAFLDEPYDKDEAGSRSKFRAMLSAAFEHVINGDKGWDAAFRALLEQYAGKARISKEELALAVAEHFRAVAKDRIEIGRQLLGKRAETMSDAELTKFWDLCERDPRRFLLAASAILEDQTASPPAAQPEVPPRAANEAMLPEAGTIHSPTESAASGDAEPVQAAPTEPETAHPVGEAEDEDE